MFKGQPKGLYALALANTGERFGYYTMLAIFLLFLQAKFGFTAAAAGQFYAIFLAAVYFMPVLGGWLADKIGFGKCVVTGVSVMFVGYLCLAIPTNVFTNRGLALTLMIGALLLIAVGTGLFKGNLQVLVGNLYDDPKYAAKRDSAFSLFYMAINIGAMFAPTAATALTNAHLRSAGLIYKADIPALAHQYLAGTLADTSLLESLQAAMPGAGVAGMDLEMFSKFYISNLAFAYNLGFAVACISLIFSILIYLSCRKWFKHADVNAKQAAAGSETVVELTPKQTKDRITALVFVFAVVIFFWMAFHQNGSSLTYCPRLHPGHRVRPAPHRLQHLAALPDRGVSLHAVRHLPVRIFQGQGHLRRRDASALGRRLCDLFRHGRGAEYPAAAVPAVQSLLRGRPHTGLHGPVQRPRQEGQGAFRAEEDRPRHVRGRTRLPGHARRL